MHPQDTGTGWGVLNMKNRTYLIWRLYNKAINSEKSQLSFKVLALIYSLMANVAQVDKGSLSSSPGGMIAPSVEAICSPGVTSSFTLKETGLPEVPLCLDFITTITAFFMLWPSYRFSPQLPSRQPVCFPIKPWGPKLTSTTSMIPQWSFPPYPDLQVLCHI